jgi:hypothetical protein
VGDHLGAERGDVALIVRKETTLSLLPANPMVAGVAGTIEDGRMPFRLATM